MEIIMKQYRSKVALVGGDLRMLYASSYFIKEGSDASLFACGAQGQATSLEEALEGAGSVVLPIPVSRNGVHLNAPYHDNPLPLSDLADCIGKNTVVYAGKISRTVSDIFRARGVECRDYAAETFYAETNAAYTVEGALAIAVESSPKALAECHVSVFGAGNIGKRLSAALKVLGSKVSVFTRNERDASYIRFLGLNDCEYANAGAVLPFCDVLFNTVPDEKIAAHFACAGKNTLIIDLAGVKCPDGACAVKALALPAKYSPQSAGELIARTVIGMGGAV